MKKENIRLRSDVREIIFDDAAKERAVTGANNEQIFYLFKNSSVLGEKILNSFRTKKLEKNGLNLFYSDDRAKKAGYLSDIYGNTGVLSLLNRMNVTLTPEDEKNLVDSVYNIVDYIEENGYTAEPYITAEENKVSGVELFNENYPYVGAMTWALSFFVSVRKACKLGQIKISQEYADKIVALIIGIIKEFNNAFIDGEKAIGWGFTKECETPSLFFTYSVLEAYSDFDDNVLTMETIEDEEEKKKDIASDQELLDKIKAVKGYEKPLHELWREKCFRVADRVWDAYQHILKDEFVDDTFIDGFKSISRDDILKANSSNALFNTVYIVFILFYGYVNTRKAKSGDDLGEADVIQTMNAALQNVQRVYEQFKRDGSEYIVDTYYIGFKSKHLNERRRNLYTKILNSKMLVDAKLMPTLVKANNVIAFHIEKYPVKQMSNLFIQLMENLPSKEGEFVWEAGAYDVKITERYIEAIADFYAYYETYERLYSQAFDKNTILQEDEREALKKQGAEERRRSIKAQVNREFAETEKKIHAEYTIENAIREGIKASVEAMVLDACKHIIAHNNGQKVNLTKFETDLSGLIPQLLLSLLGGSIANACETAKGVDPAVIRERLKGDADKFADKWAAAIVKDIDSSSNEVISRLLDKENMK